LGLSDYIQAIPAVSDISFTDIAIRPDATAFASKTYLKQAKTDIITKYPLYAGYAVEETTAGETWTDRIIFQAVN
jgi:hypothetical protein